MQPPFSYFALLSSTDVRKFVSLPTGCSGCIILRGGWNHIPEMCVRSLLPECMRSSSKFEGTRAEGEYQADRRWLKRLKCYEFTRTSEPFRTASALHVERKKGGKSNHHRHHFSAVSVKTNKFLAHTDTRQFDIVQCVCMLANSLNKRIFNG